MKIKEIREKTDQEIQTKIKDLKEGLMRLRFRMVTDQIEDNSQFGKIRKDIARLKTVLRERPDKTASATKLPNPVKAATDKSRPATRTDAGAGHAPVSGKGVTSDEKES